VQARFVEENALIEVQLDHDDASNPGGSMIAAADGRIELRDPKGIGLEYSR
jgi:hypothetical protein